MNYSILLKTADVAKEVPSQSMILHNLLKVLSDPLKLTIVVAVFLVLCAASYYGFRIALKRKGILAQYARVFSYVWKYKLALGLVVGFSLLVAIAETATVSVAEPFANEIKHDNFSSLYNIAILMVVLALGMGACSFVKTYFHQYLMGRIYVDIRSATADNLMGLSLDFYDRRKTGGLLARLTNDVMVTQKSVDFMLGDIVENPFKLICLASVIFLACWELGVVILIGLPLIALPMAIFGKRIRKYSHKSLRKQADATQSIHQSFSGIRVVKAFGMETEERGEFRADNERYFRKFMGVIRNRATSNSMVVLLTRGGAALLIALTAYVLSQHLWDMTVGKMVVIAGAAMLMNPPIKGMVKAYNKLQESMAGAGRVFELMDIKPTVSDKPGAEVLPPFKNEIVFEDVNFAYEQESILSGIDLKVKAGQMVAIVGPSGSGKSTLMNLVPRFYDPVGGRVLIDGHDLRDVTAHSILDKIAIVTQEPFLFHATVRDNIRYGKRGATEEEIIAAARAANAHDFIVKELAEGYDTIAGERGTRLSGGQKQRITIARAILKNPAILLLDEATSSLDSTAERLVQEAIDRLTESRTTIVIAHRLSTVIHADVIVVMTAGHIVGRGSHNELMKTCEPYRLLYKSQFAHTTTQHFTK